MILELVLLFQLWVPREIAKPLHMKCVLRDTSVNIPIIHYDSAPSFGVTRSWLNKKRLGYHYYIQRDGTVVRLLDPHCQGAHAGLSYYKGFIRLNDHSVGIALQNIPPQDYTQAQYMSLAYLLTRLEHRFPDIRHEPVVGHSDIAIPRGRKKDPGPKFQWARVDSLRTSYRRSP